MAAGVADASVQAMCSARGPDACDADILKWGILTQDLTCSPSLGRLCVPLELVALASATDGYSCSVYLEAASQRLRNDLKEVQPGSALWMSCS